MLDSYASVKNNIEDILNRVQLEEDEKGFMPFKSKKDPLSAAEISLFKDWMSQGMPE